ncbi:MAG: hypothetical protein ACRELV_14950 [Longimicrobiales bacterium]
MSTTLRSGTQPDLPRLITVQLRDMAGRALTLPDIAVRLNLLRLGRAYYDVLIGLTDERGLARIEGRAIEDRFQLDRRKYPTDYTADLGACDRRIQVELLSGAEILAARTLLREHDVRGPLRDIYDRAQNQGIRPVTIRFPLPLAGADIVIPVRTERV